MKAATHEFEQAGIVVTGQQTTRPGEATHLARSAVQAGVDLVIACGGDGTINEVVCGMAHSRVPLAILPAGTANVLAREISLPLNIAAAARAIPSSTPQRLALGRVGSRYFLLMAGVGFDARVVKQVNGHSKKFLGMGSYIAEAIREALFGTPVPFLLSTATERHRATFACIARSRHYGPIKMIREANLYSEQFYIYCFHSENRFRYFRYALAVLRGNAHSLPDVSRFAASEIRCEPAGQDGQQVFLQVDGESAGELPCAIQIVPDALTLLVPAGFGR
jgi:diacylglycerol kinase (ATP)